MQHVGGDELDAARARMQARALEVGAGRSSEVVRYLDADRAPEGKGGRDEDGWALARPEVGEHIVARDSESAQCTPHADPVRALVAQPVLRCDAQVLEVDVALGADPVTQLHGAVRGRRRVASTRGAPTGAVRGAAPRGPCAWRGSEAALSRCSSRSSVPSGASSTPMTSSRTQRCRGFRSSSRPSASQARAMRRTRLRLAGPTDSTGFAGPLAGGARRAISVFTSQKASVPRRAAIRSISPSRVRKFRSTMRQPCRWRWVAARSSPRRPSARLWSPAMAPMEADEDARVTTQTCRSGSERDATFHACAAGGSFCATAVTRGDLALQTCWLVRPPSRCSGSTASAITVEADIHTGLPSFTIVGLGDAAVQESRERVRAALVNSGFDFPLRRITVNLAPADLRKAGPAFDLALAAGLLAASGQAPPERLAGHAFCGELGLDGSVRRVRGAIAMADAAATAGCEGIVVPPRQRRGGGAGGRPGRDPGRHRARACRLPGRRRPARGRAAGRPWLADGRSSEGEDFAQLRGHRALKHALEVAAAGNHNVLHDGSAGQRQVDGGQAPALDHASAQLSAMRWR